ncbi:MAG: InlB B-repeat-containing protein, partial [Clostridia bacterium]|nr:InlB B-repeat-containing protein [Clostridia bacterium]
VDCYEENYEFGEKITEYIPPEKEGYTFDGWTPEVAEKMPAYDLEYTALYTVNNYTITYNVDGELYDEKTYEFNSNVTKLETPVKAGFIFSGWDDCEPDKMPAYNITLNGSFHPAPAEYTVETYIMNTDGTYDKSSEVFNSTTGENVTAEYTISEGFALNTEKSILEGEVAADGSLILKVYIDRNRHNISFNDGTNTTTDELYYGDDINKPDDPEKEGYTFEGWSEDGETVVDVEESVPDRDIEYIAVWSINSYTITFKYGEVNDNAEYKTIIKEFGKEIEEVADPEFTGYTFDGWDTDIPDTMPAQDITITALWTVIEHTVRFETNGGTPIDSIKVSHGEKADKPEAPQKQDFIFTGWYTDEELKKPFDFNTPVTDNITLYAKWSSVIEFGSYPQSQVTSESILSELNAMLTEDSWVSYGYYTGGEASDFMKYADVEYNGEKYRAVTFSEYRPSVTTNTPEFSYSANSPYQQYNGYDTDAVYWFRYDPLVWRVLDYDTGLLLCENIIDSQPYTQIYYEKGEFSFEFYNGTDYSNYANDYSSSFIRAWLNEDFLNTAFSSSQQKKIITSQLDCFGATSTYDSETTNDKIFLLSYDEVLNPDYGFASENEADAKRIAAGSDYAKCQVLWPNSYIGSTYTTPSGDSSSYWRLRTGGESSSISDIVGYDGAVSRNSKVGVTCTYAGIRPSLRTDIGTINSHTITFDTDGGTEIDPITQDYGTEITKPADPEKEGCTFDGWDTDIPDTMPDEDMTITALWIINEYSVTYKLDGADYFATPYESAVDKFNYGETVPVREKAVKEGYTVSDWAFTPALIDGKMPAGNVVANATSIINSYNLTVTYEMSDGKDELAPEAYSQAVEYGKDYSVTSPEVTGYTPDVAAVEGTMGVGDVAVTVKYSPKPHTVTWNVDGEKTVDEYVYGDDIIKPDDPTKEGYDFIGWSEDGETVVDVAKTVPDGDIEYIAVWSEKQYTVTYKLDGGKIDESTDDVTVSRKYTDTVDTNKPANPEKEGNSFEGWAYTYTDSDNNTVTVSASDTNVPYDITATALWTAKEYTVTYKLDGVEYFATPYESAVDTFTYGSEITVREKAVKEGYTVSDWAFTPALVDGKMPAGDVVANAISTVNKYTLTVNYVMNDGSDAPEAHTELVTYGAGYSVETPAVTGYTPDTDMVEGTMDSTEGKTVTVTYYVNSYKITYNVDGKLYDEKTYEFNADVTKLAAPEKQGYVFSGWDKDEPEKMPAENLVLNGSFSAATNTKYVIETYTMNLSGEYDKTSKGFTGTTGETATAEYTVPEGFSLNTDKSELEGVIAADSSLVLKVYLDRNRHNISFNDGTNTTTDELYYGDDIVKPADPEKEGYTFEGWSEDGETVVDVEETVPDRDIEYIAVWSINSYTITFKYGEVNDNAVYKTITADYGTEIEEVANPEFTGYSFGGWDTDIPDTMPAKDMTITALWSANEYKITYKLDGVDYFATPYESAVDTFTYGSEVTVREKAVKEGYTVSDWAFTPALVDGKMPAGDVVANATSTVNSYTVTYKVDGEQYGEVDTVKYEAPLTAREAPAKTGYTFSGWSDIPETMPAHDIVIEGTFSVNSHTIAFDTDGGTEIDPITQDYGTEITKPADPEKEGCTFDGWDTDIPDTMPDEDMTITAKWTVNEYSVTYKLDGVEYFATPYESAVDTFTYGSEVTVRPNAVKEGYTVSDWAFTPTLVDGKMPAGNVVANATSTVKSYTVTYKVDGVQYGEVDTVEFGAPLTARQEPEKDGYIFSGWSAIPETMPACNIEITGSFNMIYYTATFVTVNDDGSYTVVDKVPFPYGALTIDEPAVPERDNYEGVWEEYVPGNSDITVKAIYTPIDPNDNSEVITEKTVNSFDGKVASITLSASAASRVIKMESSSTKPVDVVLVLDLSGSMNDPLGSDTSTTKLEALKKCTVDFIKDLNSNAVASGADHRVALVSFASGSEKYANQKWENTGLVLTQDGGFVSYPEASSHYDKAFMSPGNITGPNQAIINAVNGFTASGATCTHCGLKMAESILAQNNGADREKVVILITDGTPTVGSEVKSEINASAPIAVTYAKNLKKSGVKLYTVGVSAYADENASFTNDEDGVKTRTNGFGNEEFISFDFNRFLNIVSSNYPDSSSMSNYGSKTNDGYYMPVTDTSRLGDIFTKILRSTVYKNLIFKRCNIVDTLSSDFVMTMEQENAFRASLKDEYGISDDDISVIRNEDGTTTVRVNKVPVIRTVENGATVYRASVTFNASLIETQAGSYETNTDDAYIEVQDETVGTFDKPEAVTLNSDRNIVVFKLNGEIYTVSEGDIGDEVVAPVSEFAAWNIPEGTVITGNYAEFEADEIVTDPYTVTWNIDGNLSHETYYFGQRINEPEVPEKEGFDFAFFSPSIPAVMPARNVTFTAVYKPKHVHSFKQTGFYGTCTEGLTIVSTCSCGEISEEKQPAAVHNFSAVVENISGNALTDTLVCETCGASERHTLEFSTVERRYGRTYIVDLTLEKSGTIIQPAEGSSVKIMIPWENQGYTNRYVTIYRVNENNVQTKYTPTFEDGYLVFYADHFSIYIIDETDESGNPVNNISFNEATCSLNGHSFEWKYNNDATSEADGTETEVCKNCGEKGETRKADGTKLSTDPGQNTEPEYRLPSSFKEKTAAYKTIVTVSVTLNDIPSDAKVIIDGKEADVNKNTYSMEIGQLKATKDVLIEVVKDGKILDSSTLTVKVESNFFSRLISFFANFLFNMFKWREVTVKF